LLKDWFEEPEEDMEVTPSEPSIVSPIGSDVSCIQESSSISDSEVIENSQIVVCIHCNTMLY